MAKRFTETLKWDDPWFLDLNSEEKLLWLFLCDKCDISGVIDFSPRHADFFINGSSRSSSNIKSLEDRITKLESGKYFLKGFIEFQYGTLKPSCKPHLAVIKMLEKNGISIDDVKQSNKIGKCHNISAKTRSFVIQRDGKTCAYCEKSVNNFDINLDHVIPRTKGGSDEADNLVVSCNKCNSSKGDLSLLEFIKNNTLSDSVIERVSERVSVTLKDKDKDKEEEKEKDKEEEKEEDKTNEIKRFIPPQLHEVSQYCIERNNGIDAQKFIDHYSTNGWMRGKNKIKDWKACVRTWEKNNPKKETEKSIWGI